MINVSDATKQLYYESSHKNLVISLPNKNITLTNTNLIQESPELTELLEPENELTFTGCNSSTFKFKVAGLIQDIRDEYIEVTIQAGNTDIIPLFSGYVVSQNNRTYEDVVTEVECQDILYKLRNVDVTSWYNGLTFPITMKNFRNSFFTYIGLEQVVDVYSPDDTGDLINDALTLTKVNAEKLPKVLNAGDIMRYICQCNARYGQYGRDKKFHYRELIEIIRGLYPSYETFPSETTYPSDENANIRYNLQHYKKINYEPYEVEHIDCVVIRDDKGNATKYGGTTSEENVFVIADNFLAYSFSDKAAACQNIYGKVGKVWYIPMTLDCIGLPWVECGDIILTRTKKNIVRGYMLQRTLKGIHALFDTITATGEQYREMYKESEATSISTNRSNTKDNADEITATKLRVGSIEADYIKTAQLNAVDAKIDNLTAIAITTQNLSAQSINASQITAGTISAARIGSSSISADKLDANSFSSWSLNCQSVSVGSYFAVGGHRYSATPVTISGQGYTILAQ